MIEVATVAFLKELRERAREYGWRGDYIEIARFVADLHKDAGIEFPPEFWDGTASEAEKEEYESR